jgi:hypothetical protein
MGAFYLQIDCIEESKRRTFEGAAHSVIESSFRREEYVRLSQMSRIYFADQKRPQNSGFN